MFTIMLNKCSEENGVTCSGTKEEIDTYFNGLTIGYLYNDNYLEYSDISSPHRFESTGGTLRVSNSLDY